MKFTKGLFTDSKPIKQPEGTYRYSLNVLLTKKYGVIINETEGETFIDFENQGLINCKLIGHVYGSDGNVYLFVKNGDKNLILRFGYLGYIEPPTPIEDPPISNPIDIITPYEPPEEESPSSSSDIDEYAPEDENEFEWLGLTYKVIVKNGLAWLDRNLGATRAATASDDAQSYGDLYQWGRFRDGHQIRTSGTTTTLATTDIPGHGNFIVTPDIPYDWRNPQNDNLWQGANGTNNPAPTGWRLPTEAELHTERVRWGSDDAAGAFGSLLKLPVPGWRARSDGSLRDVGSEGFYWASTVSGTSARAMSLKSSVADINSFARASGFSIRCVRDL